jgi:hypothetical protein
MLLLISTSDKIQVITGSAVSTMNVEAVFADYNAPAITPGRTNTAITTATTTDVVAAPGSGVQRNVKRLSVYNSHATSSNLVTVKHTDGTTVSILVAYTLLPGEILYYVEAGYFAVTDVTGTRKASPNTGGFIKSTILVGGTSFITGPNTHTIRVKLQACGGGAGGTITNTTSGSAGGGGASGGYAEKLFAVSPCTPYTYAIGFAGSAPSGANGTAGGNVTFVVGGTTVTTFGGNFGTTSTGSTLGVNLGGASPAISTSGDLNCGGMPGGPGIILSAAVITSGSGGTCLPHFGVGGSPRISQSSGVSGTVGSGGGGGGLVSAGANNAGGGGSVGLIVVEEYV